MSVRIRRPDYWLRISLRSRAPFLGLSMAVLGLGPDELGATVVDVLSLVSVT